MGLRACLPLPPARIGPALLRLARSGTIPQLAPHRVARAPSALLPGCRIARWRAGGTETLTVSAAATQGGALEGEGAHTALGRRGIQTFPGVKCKRIIHASGVKVQSAILTARAPALEPAVFRVSVRRHGAGRQLEGH